MGVLHRMVDLLKLVDPDNSLWLGLKLQNVDPAQRVEFKKVLTNHSMITAASWALSATVFTGSTFSP